MSKDNHTLASLETAACLWEAVLALESSRPRTDTSRAIRRLREAIGSSALRLCVLEWVDVVDEAWKVADTDPETGREGFYGQSFDWDFIPGWIEANVDWSAEYPALLVSAS